MSKPVVICLTPVKNEVWIIDRFLKCASLWADHIIIADQLSDDGSREIALSYPKVTLVDNPSATFNEPERQKILLDAARRLPGPRLLIALDADEILTANFLNSPEWNTLLQAPLGTVVHFQLPVVRHDLCSYWMAPGDKPFGFMDDGSEHVGKIIHSPRIPIPAQAPKVMLRDIKVMHYVGVDMERWKSKHRWYQCLESLHQTHRRPIGLYREYHRNDVIPSTEIKPVPREWLSGYEQQEIDMTSVHREGIFHSDKQMLELLVEFGPKKFKRMAIWDVNWNELYRKISPNGPPLDLSDPRNRFDKHVHRWLKKTQPYFAYFRQDQPLSSRLVIRAIEKMLMFFGW